MQSLYNTLKSKVTAAFRVSFEALGEDFECVLTKSTQASFGHYQCNSAMKLTKVLNLKPRDIAQAIQAQLEKDPILSLVEVAGPGFINLTLSPSFLADFLKAHTLENQFGLTQPLAAQKKVIIDFSSPNIAKEMHVGHLRSTIIGDSLSRVFEFAGYDVLRLNHIGDWGTAFGMLIAYLKESHPKVITEAQPATLIDLMQWYRAAKKRFDEEPAFKKAAQLAVIDLQAHEATAYQAWQVVCAISREAYQEIYDLLDIQINERGESFYNDALPGVVSALEEQGLLTLSDGAQCLYLDGFNNREGDPLPFMIQKSDGGYNYATTDMAAIRHRAVEEAAARIIYVTDAGQATHFSMLFQAAKKAGFVDIERVRLDHVPFGLVLGSDGKKFKTRSGDTERLIDLLTEAVSRSKGILDERDIQMPPEEKETLAKALGIGAVKYADLSCDRTQDYRFSYDRMLQFEGNTAAFLLYSLVRIKSILRKIDSTDVTDVAFDLSTPIEQQLAVGVCQFQETLEHLIEDLMPNRLCEYLFGLAELFNQFFRDCRVAGDEKERARVKLCLAVQSVLTCGLELLGIQPVQRM